MALARARVCVQNMTRVHIKMQCNMKNGTFRVYYPPSTVFCSYVFVCNLHAPVGIRTVLVCIRLSLACIRMSLVCTRISYVLL